jgi:type I restriction enzyme S subunit
MTPETQNQPSPNWHKTTISRSSYLKGRIGWQGLRASEFLEEGPYLITGTDFRNGAIDWKSCYHVTEERYQEAKYIHVKDNDVLITKDGTIGKVAFVRDCPDKAVLNSGIFLLRCNDGSYEHEFMYHLLNSYVFSKFLDDNLAGSTIQHLYQNVFERFEFPIPDKPQQTQIAAVLSTVDRAIAQTEALIAKQQCIKTGLMQDLLTKGIDENGNIRSEATHRFKDSPLGRIPEEWEISSVEEIAIKVTDGDHHTPKRSVDGVFLLSARNVLNGIIDISNVDYISEVEYQRMIKRCHPEAGDILISCSGTIGRICEVPNWLKCALVRSAALVKLNRELLFPRYAEWCLRSDYAQIQIKASQRQAAQPNLFQNEIEKLILFRPSIREQKTISTLLDTHEDLVKDLIKTLDKLLVVKLGLMQDLLTGKVPVTPLLETEPSPVGQT